MYIWDIIIIIFAYFLLSTWACVVALNDGSCV
jgi:hypothetical protein